MNKMFLLSIIAVSGCGNDMSHDPIAGAGTSDTLFIQKLQVRQAQGDSTAALNLVLVEYWNRGMYEEAIPRLEALADSGSSGAAGLLSHAFSHGLGVDKDMDKSVLWLERSADLGSAEAKRDLEYYRSNN